jgi:large subunit ribosomal protein L6
MSRFSKIPVKVPETVKIEFGAGSVKVTGPKGSLERKVPSIVEIKIDKNELMVTNTEKEESKFGKAIIGTIKSHVTNMIKGVTDGWNKKLELNGAGFRAEVRGSDLVLTIGYSHQVTITAPTGIKFTVEKNTINIEGTDREIVGEVAAKIIRVRPPDPYKGKGIKYAGAVLKLKPGKQAAKAAA